MTWIRATLAAAFAALLVPLLAQAALIQEISIPNVGKETQAEVTGRFSAEDPEEVPTFAATLTVNGNESIIAADYKTTSTKGEYAFKVRVDFGRYVSGDAKVDATLAIKSSREGQFKDLRTSIKSPRDS